MKLSILKFFYPLAFLTMPFWLGLPLLKVGITALGFALADIFPQFILDPFSSYYGSQTNQGFSDNHIPAIALWVVVFAIYSYASREKTLEASMFIFAGIALVAVVLVHVTLALLGYRFVVDSI